jgi:hypothetical protein
MMLMIFNHGTKVSIQLGLPLLGDHCVAEGNGKYEVNVNLCVGIRHFFQ